MLLDSNWLSAVDILLQHGYIRALKIVIIIIITYDRMSCTVFLSFLKKIIISTTKEPYQFKSVMTQN